MSNRQPKARQKNCAMWEKLREDILAVVLYSTDLEGIGLHISLLVKAFLPKYEVLPFARVRRILSRLLLQNGLTRQTFITDHVAEENHPVLPFYGMIGRSLILGSGLKRKNEWNLEICLQFFGARRNSKKKSFYLVRFTRCYIRQHAAGISPSILDTYARAPVHTFTFKRYGCLGDLTDEFVYSLQDLILSGVQRLKRMPECPRHVKKRGESNSYVVLCGGKLDGCDICRHCFDQRFEDFLDSW